MARLTFKQWIIWRAVRRALKKALKDKHMLDKITSFLPGLKSRLGGLGVALAAVAAWMTQVADTAVWDLDAIIAAVKGLFAILASYGVWDKFVRSDGFLQKIMDLISKLTDKD